MDITIPVCVIGVIMLCVIFFHLGRLLEIKKILQKIKELEK